ncbi:MAG TPA: toprim domain-containing protein [Nitrososphaerales archaeon]|nr:toprim domain-containing protein [Nitrososphaerales archaeon]
MIDTIADFLAGFIGDLNKAASEGWVLLVEGPRDARAMKGLGYRGRVLTLSSLSVGLGRGIGNATGVVILTDLDREGRMLAARYAKLLSHEGIQTTLAERKRLLVASNGVFRQIENLSRFADQSPE